MSVGRAEGCTLEGRASLDASFSQMSGVRGSTRRAHVCVLTHITERCSMTYCLDICTTILDGAQHTLLVSTHSWLAHTPGQHTLLVRTHSWTAHTPGQHTLLDSTHSWLVHTPGQYTLLVSTHSWLVHTPGQYTLLVSTHSWSVHTPG